MPKDLSLTGKLHYIFALLFFTVACAPENVKEETVYDWVIPQDSMVLIMTDVHIAEGAKIGQKTIGDSLSVDAYYNKIWDKYNITRARYDSNFYYYSRNASKMDEVIARVLERLSQMEGTHRGQNGKDKAEDGQEEEGDNQEEENPTAEKD